MITYIKKNFIPNERSDEGGDTDLKCESPWPYKIKNINYPNS